MRSTAPRSALGLVLALAGSLLGTALIGVPTSSAAPADDPSDEWVQFTDVRRRADFPVLVSTDPSLAVTVSVHVQTFQPAHGVTVTAEGEGLEVTPRTTSLGDFGDFGAQIAEVRVVATTPGVHSLTFTLTAEDQPTRSLTFPYVWAPGGEPLPATGDLSGRSYGWQGRKWTSDEHVRVATMLTFLGPRAAYIGMPRHGKPRCRSVADKQDRTTGCVPYFHDSSTGLVQVGALIGRIDGPNLYIEGFTPPDPRFGETFGRFYLDQTAVYAAPGRRFSGGWSYRDRWQRPGLRHIELSLRKGGAFELRYRYSGRDPVARRGRYQVTGPGRLALTSNGRTTVHTLALATGPGCPVPGGGGLWLSLTAPGGRPDGVCVAPRRD